MTKKYSICAKWLFWIANDFFLFRRNFNILHKVGQNLYNQPKRIFQITVLNFPILPNTKVFWSEMMFWNLFVTYQSLHSAVHNFKIYFIGPIKLNNFDDQCTGSSKQTFRRKLNFNESW